MPHTDPLEQSFDRFTLPTDIPDAAYWTKDGTFEEAVRRRAAARAGDNPPSGHPELVEGGSFSSRAAFEEKAVLRQAQHDRDRARGYSPSHPAGRGWVPKSRDLGIPGEHLSFPTFSHDGVEYVFAGGTPEDVIAKIGCGEVFTRERRVRFLDHLAFKGNVRAAAAQVNVSHETAYRARRQDAAFAALWDAAMVHARSYGEQVLATRALDGIEVPIVQRGEIVGYQTRHDTRLLLAHLARLDQRVETDAAAVARAAHFDPLLAQYAGHEAPDPFEAAVEEVRARQQQAAPLDVPPTRDEYLAYFRGLAMDAAEELEETEAAVEEEFMEQAGEEWDAWHQGALAKVGSIVEGTVEDESPSPLAGEEGAPSGAEGEGSAASAADLARGNQAAADAADPSPNPLPQGERAKCQPDTVHTDLPYEVKSIPPRHGEGDHAEHGGGAHAGDPDLEGTGAPHVPLHQPAAGPPPHAGEEPKPAEFRRFEPCHRRQPPLVGGPDRAWRSPAAQPRLAASPETPAPPLVGGSARRRRPTLPQAPRP